MKAETGGKEFIPGAVSVALAQAASIASRFLRNTPSRAVRKSYERTSACRMFGVSRAATFGARMDRGSIVADDQAVYFIAPNHRLMRGELTRPRT